MTSEVSFSVTLADETKTRELGAAIAGELRSGDIIILSGELGAGKTTFVKGVVAALDDTVEVTSPTFALCHRYECSPPVAHVDCWRMKSASELVDLALEELLEDGWIALIEWGERLDGLFDDDALTMMFVTSGESRTVIFASRADRWVEVSSRIAELCSAVGETT